MDKTKLGLPVGVCVAATYLIVFFGGWIPALLLLGFILLYEENTTLKISVVTAVALALACALANALIGLIPEFVELIRSLIHCFDPRFYLEMPTRVTNFLYSAVSLAKTVVFVLLAWFAAMDKPKQPAFIKKYFD